jgi:hypothetical protein
MNDVGRIIYLMRNGVNFNFKHDGATESLRSACVYETSLFNGQFALKARVTSESISRATVTIN